MPPFGPIKRRDMIRAFGRLGFTGPFPRGKHHLMQRGLNWVVIPNPHGSDISRDLLARILREAGISREEWERL